MAAGLVLCVAGGVAVAGWAAWDRLFPAGNPAAATFGCGERLAPQADPARLGLRMDVVGQRAGDDRGLVVTYRLAPLSGAAGSVELAGNAEADVFVLDGDGRIVAGAGDWNRPRATEPVSQPVDAAKPLVLYAGVPGSWICPGADWTAIRSHPVGYTVAVLRPADATTGFGGQVRRGGPADAWLAEAPLAALPSAATP